MKSYYFTTAGFYMLSTGKVWNEQSLFQIKSNSLKMARESITQLFPNSVKDSYTEQDLQNLDVQTTFPGGILSIEDF